MWEGQGCVGRIYEYVLVRILTVCLWGVGGRGASVITPNPSHEVCLCVSACRRSAPFIVCVLTPSSFCGSRLLPDQTVFSSVVWLLHSAQEQGDCALPRPVLRSALCLLAATQDRSPDLDGVTRISSRNGAHQTSVFFLSPVSMIG